jgi:hypothetical protein
VEATGGGVVSSDRPERVDLGRLRHKHVVGYCQTDSNQSQFTANSVNLPGTELTPLGESGGTVELEVLS